MSKNTKFAIIETGGKQYKVEAGTIIDIEKINGNKLDKVTFDKVLLVADDKQTIIGQPYIKSAKVEATILNQIKDKKITVFKFKKKTGYKVKQGHRQKLSTIKIEEVQTSTT